LTAAELTELGAGLYQLLRQLTDYRVAQVGWDPERLVDLTELEQEWADEIAAGQMDGLVLAEDMRHHLGTDAFEPFAVGFIWIPYRGEPRKPHGHGGRVIDPATARQRVGRTRSRPE
jgi:hypothetical protein